MAKLSARGCHIEWRLSRRSYITMAEQDDGLRERYTYFAKRSDGKILKRIVSVWATARGWRRHDSGWKIAANQGHTYESLVWVGYVEDLNGGAQ